jgi:cytochrome c oxidase subunit 1
MSSAGASILGVGYLLPICYLFVSLIWGRKAPANPWDATGLEWQVSSPPSPHNFDRTPEVTEGPYAYQGTSKQLELPLETVGSMSDQTDEY